MSMNKNGEYPMKTSVKNVSREIRLAHYSAGSKRGRKAKAISDKLRQIATAEAKRRRGRVWNKRRLTPCA